MARVQAIGPFAVNQAAKAIAIASGYLEADHLAITCLPHFLTLILDGEERSALQFVIEVKPQ